MVQSSGTSLWKGFGALQNSQATARRAQPDELRNRTGAPARSMRVSVKVAESRMENFYFIFQLVICITPRTHNPSVEGSSPPGPPSKIAFPEPEIPNRSRSTTAPTSPISA